MIKLSVCSYTLKKNKELVDVTLYDPPIIVWKGDKEIDKVFSYDIAGSGRLTYRPESPLPNGATVYVEGYE